MHSPMGLPLAGFYQFLDCNQPLENINVHATANFRAHASMSLLDDVLRRKTNIVPRNMILVPLLAI